MKQLTCQFRWLSGFFGLNPDSKVDIHQSIFYFIYGTPGFTFSDVYIKYKDFLINDNILYIEAEPSKKNEDDTFKVITKKIYDIKKIRKKLSQNVHLKIDFHTANPTIIDNLYKIAESFPGECNLILHILNNKGKLNKIKSTNIFISNDILCIKAFKNKLGEKNVWLS